MEKGNTWLLVLLIACLVIGLGTLGVAFNQPDPASAKDIASQIVVPSAPPAPEIDIDALATAVASKIPAPIITETESVTNTDSSSSDRLCELKNNCKVCFKNFEGEDSTLAQDYLSETRSGVEYKRLRQAVKEITGLGYNDYELFEVGVDNDGEPKDSYNYAVTCKEGDKGNFETQLLYRIDYLEKDTDEVDNEILYVLVTSTVEDNEDVSIKSVEKVDRKFEIKK